MTTNLMKYAFWGLLGFMALVLTLRFLEGVPLWMWALFCLGLGGLYLLYKRWMKR